MGGEYRSGQGWSGRGWSGRELLVLFAITGVAAALRLFRIEQWSVSATEAATWRSITQPMDGASGILAGEAGPYPLVPLALRWLIDVGLLPFHGEGWLRLPFAFAGIVAVPLAALVANLVAARGAALLAAGLLAVHPWHVAQSQTADPAGIALLFSLGSMAAAVAGRGASRWPYRLLCAFGAMLTLLTHAAGWLLLFLLAAGWVASRWPAASPRGRRLLAGALLLGLLLPPLAVAAVGPLDGAPVEVVGEALRSFAEALGVPLLIVAVASMALWRPAPGRVLLGVLTPIAAACLAEALGFRTGPDVLLFLLPPFLLLAAVAMLRCFELVRAGLPGGPRPAVAAAALAPFALGCSLLVDTVLYSVAHQGFRPPWRLAAGATLNRVGTGRGLLVGAAVGWPNLNFYLRPNHWRGSATDPHPGIRVAALDLADPIAALRELVAAARGASVAVALRCDEVDRVDALPAGKALLRRSFRLERVLPCPLDMRDETLYVFRAVD